MLDGDMFKLVIINAIEVIIHEVGFSLGFFINANIGFLERMSEAFTQICFLPINKCT
jgi:hypothetical protein